MGGEDEATETTITAVAGEDDPPEEDIIQEVEEDVAKDSQIYIPTVYDCGPSVLFKEIKQVTIKDTKTKEAEEEDDVDTAKYVLLLEPLEVHCDVNDDNNKLNDGANNGTNEDKPFISDQQGEVF
eukprot:15365566-Ditylum_brightwellii.AAC.1